MNSHRKPQSCLDVVSLALPLAQPRDDKADDQDQDHDQDQNLILAGILMVLGN